MSTVELIEELKRMNNQERLELIEAASRMVRENLQPGSMSPAAEQERRLRDAAARLQAMYEPGGELTEWTALDAEEVADDYLSG